MQLEENQVSFSWRTADEVLCHCFYKPGEAIEMDVQSVSTHYMRNWCSTYLHGAQLIKPYVIAII